MPYYFEQARCVVAWDSTTSSEVLSYYTGCIDTYVDHNTPLPYICQANCGIGRYGIVSFDWRSTTETSQCTSCSSSCYECVGSSINDCISCVKGYYLYTGSHTVTSGQCLPKTTPATPFTYTLKVAPPSYWTNTNIFVEDNKSNSLLKTIQDAIAYAYELGAPHTSASITILLDNPTTATPFHAMVRYNPTDFYIPQAYDSWSQTTQITIDTASGSQVKVLYKLRDNWRFKVGAGLTINNIYFEAIDSIIDYMLDVSTGTNCSMDASVQCCHMNTAGEFTGASSCQFIKKPQVCLFSFLGLKLA